MAVSLRSQLSDGERADVEGQVADFGRTWHEHALAERVRSLPPPSSRVRLVLLSDLVRVDLSRQWQNGRRPTVETYLEAHPELATVDSVLGALVGVEYQLRERFGPAADLNELIRRFPGHAEVLRRVIDKIEQRKAKPKPSTVSGSPQESVPDSPSRPAWPGQTPSLPEQFGRYRILKKLGQGGMGSVYLAHDTRMTRKVALKVPRFEAEEGSDALKRFHREALAAAALHHANICTVHDVDEIDGVHFLTMAYIEGNPLSEMFAPGKPLPEQQAAKLVYKLALAMQVAHEAGIAHRDLKPSNIMLTRQVEPIIVDFGLARTLHADSGRLTRTGTVLGTAAYMSPEQVMGKPEDIDARSDIYSLGVVLYEVLTGRLPFEGANPAAMYALVAAAKPPPPRGYQPELDERLQAICMKAMAKKRIDRYASMAEFSVALNSFLKPAKKTWSDTREIKNEAIESVYFPPQLLEPLLTASNRIMKQCKVSTSPATATQG